MEDLSSGLSRLHKLKGLAEKSEKKETEGKENEKDAKEFKKVEDALLVLDKISSFQKGFESEEESEEEVDDDEDDKSMMTKLDLSSVRIEQEGSQMYPSNESNIDPSAAFFMKKVNVAADTEEKDASIVPIKIRSVGEARRQHRERIKASETQILARHARHVAAKAVADTSYEEKKKAKKKKKKAESKRHVEEKSSLDYLEEDDNAPVNEYEGVILLSDLRYTEFSSNYIMRGDLIKQCGDLLQSRSTIVLRTVAGEDALDAKMMLRTIATELAMYHASEFIIPEIKYDTVSDTTEMRLDPK